MPPLLKFCGNCKWYAAVPPQHGDGDTGECHHEPPRSRVHLHAGETDWAKVRTHDVVCDFYARA